jgi:hypothetical protein
MSTEQPYGLMAEFDDPNTLVAAAREARAAGYRRMDGYSPFAIEELHEALGVHHTLVPLLVLLGGIAGACSGFGLAYWVSVVAYPINVGGRPFNSWPAFIVPTFELTVLFAAVTAVFGSPRCITRCSTSRGSRWPPGIGSSCASKRGTRGSTCTGRGSSSRGWARAR